MPSYNKATIIGHLGRDPELRYATSGTPICNFTVATNETWGKGENKQERTEWHRCVAFGKLADICGEYLQVGSLTLVEGRIQTRSWEDKEGNTRHTTEIVANKMVMLGGKENQHKSGTKREDRNQIDADDDIPF